MFTALVIVITLSVAVVTVHWVVPRRSAIRLPKRGHRTAHETSDVAG